MNNLKKKILLSLNIFILIMLFLNIPFMQASPSYEDFTTYTEVDTNNRISTTTDTVTITDLDMNEEAYLYKDKGVSHFNGDFEHLVEVQVSTFAVSGESLTVWMLSNNLATQNDHFSSSWDFLGVYFWRTYQTRLYLIEFYDSVIYQSYYTVSNGVPYYLKIKRDEGVGTLYCYVYSDSARENLLSTLTQTLHGDKDFQYVYGANSREGGGGGGATDGYIKNLDLQEVAVTFYFNDGGTLRVDNTIISNGTENFYFNGTVLDLASLPQNSSYVFSYFEWDSSNATTNPYNLTVSENMTIWLYFFPISELIDNNFILAIGLLISFGLIVCMLVVAKIKRR